MKNLYFFLLLPVITYLGLSFVALDFTWLFNTPEDSPLPFMGRLVLLGATLLAILSYDEVSRK